MKWEKSKNVFYEKIRIAKNSTVKIENAVKKVKVSKLTLYVNLISFFALLGVVLLPGRIKDRHNNILPKYNWVREENITT